MRINEAYEHEPILPYQSEESCPLNGCNKVSTQCVDVTASVILSPTAVMGSPTVTCQGNPTITCATNADGTVLLADTGGKYVNYRVEKKS